MDLLVTVSVSVSVSVMPAPRGASQRSRLALRRSTQPAVRPEGEPILVALVRGMILLVLHHPRRSIERREVGVALDDGLNEGEVQAIGPRQRETVDLRSPDHEDFGLGGAERE